MPVAKDAWTRTASPRAALARPMIHRPAAFRLTETGASTGAASLPPSVDIWSIERALRLLPGRWPARPQVGPAGMAPIGARRRYRPREARYSLIWFSRPI